MSCFSSIFAWKMRSVHFSVRALFPACTPEKNSEKNPHRSSPPPPPPSCRDNFQKILIDRALLRLPVGTTSKKSPQIEPSTTSTFLSRNFQGPPAPKQIVGDGMTLGMSKRAGEAAALQQLAAEAAAAGAEAETEQRRKERWDRNRVRAQRHAEISRRREANIWDSDDETRYRERFGPDEPEEDTSLSEEEDKTTTEQETEEDSMELVYRCVEFGVSKTSRCIGGRSDIGATSEWHRSGIGLTSERHLEWQSRAHCSCGGKHRTAKKGRSYVSSGAGLGAEHRRGIGVASE